MAPYPTGKMANVAKFSSDPVKMFGLILLNDFLCRVTILWSRKWLKSSKEAITFSQNRWLFAKSSWKVFHHKWLANELFWIILIEKLFTINKMDYSELFWYENFLPVAFLSTSQVDKKVSHNSCLENGIIGDYASAIVFILVAVDLASLLITIWSFDLVNIGLQPFIDNLHYILLQLNVHLTAVSVVEGVFFGSFWEFLRVFVSFCEF